MSNQPINRTRWLHLRLTPQEYETIKKRQAKSTCRKLSEWSRRLLLGKPVTVYTRNQSLDDFVSELILLKNELSAIGNNFNQLVKKLHTLNHISEIKSWAVLNEASKVEFMKKVEEIKEKMSKISEVWLQK